LVNPYALSRGKFPLTTLADGIKFWATVVGGTMKPASKKPSNLSEPLHRQLNSYALAATAVGAAALALGEQPAEAKIIYTPTNVNITNGLGNL